MPTKQVVLTEEEYEQLLSRKYYDDCAKATMQTMSDWNQKAHEVLDKSLGGKDHEMDSLPDRVTRVLKERDELRRRLSEYEQHGKTNWVTRAEYERAIKQRDEALKNVAYHQMGEQKALDKAIEWENKLEKIKVVLGD